MHKANDPKLAYSIGEIIERGLGGRTFLYGEIAGGRLRAVKQGRSTRVLATDLEAYLKSLPAKVEPALEPTAYAAA